MNVSYLDQWKYLKKIERLELWLFCLSIPGVIVLSILSKKIGLNISSGIIVFFCVAALFATDLAVLRFKCPRCQESFFRNRYVRNGFTKKCMHCSLPKWTPNGMSPEKYAEKSDPDDSVIGDQWKRPPK